MREPICSFDFTRTRRRVDASRWHARVVYAFRGVADVSVDAGDRWSLSRETGCVLVANAGEGLRIDPGTGGLVSVVSLDLRPLRRMLNDRPVTFACTPGMRHQASYAELVRSLDEMLRTLSETNDFAELHREAAETSLIRCLLDGFGGTIMQAQSRAEAFCSHLDLHYDEPLTLADTARRFHLSTEHFAKVFHAEVGETFHAYLTDRRLDAAAERLVSSEDTIARIALESGFPSVAALNRDFKAREGLTPSAYRKEHRVASSGLSKSMARELRHLTDEVDVCATDVLTIEIDAHADLKALHESWSDMVGIGPIEGLTDARVREQVLVLKQHIGFRHWRVGCDFGALSDERGRYRLDGCFDFLVEHGFVPHVLVERGKDTDEASYLEAFAQALRRYANRYSVQTLRAWRFEPILRREEANGPYDAFCDFVREVEHILLPYAIDTPIIAPGIFCDSEASNLREFLRTARGRGIELGAVSIACRPGAAGPDAPFVRTGDRRYLRSQVLLAREVMAEEGYDPDRLIVGSWRDSLETKNIMNDSTYEGASIMQTVLTAWDLVGSLCYNDALDLSLRTGAGDAFLSGRPGLLSRDGIPKPSYYAFNFLRSVNRHLVHASDRCLASTNDMGNYQFVCHNCERLNAVYLSIPERSLDYQVMDTYFEERRDRVLKVTMSGVRPGTYLVKARFVNDEGGSVGDEALRMRLWCMDEPSRSELFHLRSCARPQMRLERLHTTDGTLSFEHLMRSNEIAYFHIIYLY